MHRNGAQRLMHLESVCPSCGLADMVEAMRAEFSFPTRVLFGSGTVTELPAHLAALPVRKPLVVTDPGLRQTRAFAVVKEVLSGPYEVFADVRPNPTGDDLQRAGEAYAEAQCDGVIAIGGGSAIDVAKLVRQTGSAKSFAPLVAIPTTAGTGSEVGRSAVLIIDGRKQVIFHPKLLADLVILDPQLTLDLPAKLTAATGADALTHCIESLTSPVFHPMCEAIALEGIRYIAGALPRAVHQPSDLDARGQMQLAAMMGGVAFQKDLGAVHSLAHPLSTLCDLHHGLANALCLVAVMRFNAQRKPGLYQPIAHALQLASADDDAVIEWVQSLLREIGIARSLREVGVDEQMIEQLADQAVEDGCHKTNAVPVTRDELRALYRQAL
jgi:4-hydroxybutyrate dehydrogenase